MKRIKRRLSVKEGGAFLPSLLFSLLLIPSLSFAMAGVAMQMKNPSGAVGTLSLIALLLSGLISGFIISRIKGEGGFLYTLFVLLTVCLIMLAVGLISSGGRLSLGALMNYLCYIGTGLLGALLSRKGRTRRARGH